MLNTRVRRHVVYINVHKKHGQQAYILPDLVKKKKIQVKIQVHDKHRPN